MAEQRPSEQPEDFKSIGGQALAGALDTLLQSKTAQFLISNLGDILTQLLDLAFKLTVPIGTGFARAIAEAEDYVAPALADTVAAAVSDAFGQDVPASAFSAKRDRNGRQDAAAGLGRGLLTSIGGKAGPIEPGSAGAERFLGLVVNMALEGWYQGFFFEFMSSLVPQFDVGKIESFADLDDTLSRALGLGRMSRSVMRPLLDATVVTPFQWQCQKTYRPALLNYTQVARQYSRGRWTREQCLEELARQGYSDDKCEALLNYGLKFHSPADLDLLVRAGLLSREDAVQHLRDYGYEQVVADAELRLERLKRIQTFERSLANEAANAYADGRIDRGTLVDSTRGAVIDAQESAQIVELAVARRALRVKPLSVGQAEACVKAGILNVRDYREALARDGYTPEAADALELLLRWELDKARSIAEHKAQQAAERAAEKAAKAQADAEKKAALDAERAAARRGPVADLERAYVRGLIPIGRVAEIYAADYDDDTVDILVDLLEQDRQHYIAQQKAADAAERGARNRGLDVGALRSAVQAGTLTLAEFRKRLGQLGFTDADADVLTATLRAQLDDQKAAEQQRAEAARKAKDRSIDLGRFEDLVRRGRRTVDQYDVLLQELGYNAGARAAMVELLQAKIDDDAQAAAEREAGEARMQERGLSLEQLRRGVLLGVATVDDYQRFLVEQRFTADAQIVLMAELRADLDEAEAARQRRAATVDESGGQRLPLATVRRAARLGIVSPDEYAARLVAAGYTDDDVAIEMDLLLTEIADVQAARAREQQLEADAAARGTSLADVARAVKAGIASIEDYRAKAAALGYAAADVELLTRVLEEERNSLTAARSRHDAIAFQLAAAGQPFAELEAAVTGGSASLEDYAAQLAAWGVGADDAALLGSLLLFNAAKAAPASE